MAKKAPERTREEMKAYFESHDDFNAYISKKIMEEEAKKKAKKKKKETKKK